MPNDEDQSPHIPDAAFYDRADAHIHLANEHGDAVGPEVASASFLFAASRYTAFLMATQAESRQAMEAARDDAMKFFVGEFRRMLEGNVDDFLADFDRNSN
ncbi:MAG: DUF3144 domain-containing protein [Planctomycetota bacterium]